MEEAHTLKMAGEALRPATWELEEPSLWKVWEASARGKGSGVHGLGVGQRLAVSRGAQERGEPSALDIGGCFQRCWSSVHHSDFQR